MSGSRVLDCFAILSLLLRQLIGMRNKPTLRFCSISKIRICSSFAFVFFGSPSPAVILHMKLHRKKKDSKRDKDGRLGVLEPNKTMAKRVFPINITIFPLRCTLPGKIFFFKYTLRFKQTRKEILPPGVYFIAGLFFFLVLNIHTRASGPLQFVFQVRERKIPTCLSKS